MPGGGRLRNQTVEEIMRVVNEKARAGQYDLVLDKGALGAGGLPVVLSSSQASDFSDEVIAVLNTGH